MKIADLYEMTYEEFRLFVINNKSEARRILETEERFNLLKLVTKKNSYIRTAPKFYIPTDS